MPKKLDRCVRKVKASGKGKDAAWAICTKSVMGKKSKAKTKKRK